MCCHSRASSGTPRRWHCASKVCTLRLSSGFALLGLPRSCTVVVLADVWSAELTSTTCVPSSHCARKSLFPYYSTSLTSPVRSRWVPQWVSPEYAIVSRGHSLSSSSGQPEDGCKRASCLSLSRSFLRCVLSHCDSSQLLPLRLAVCLVVSGHSSTQTCSNWLTGLHIWWSLFLLWSLVLLPCLWCHPQQTRPPPRPVAARECPFRETLWKVFAPGWSEPFLVLSRCKEMCHPVPWRAPACTPSWVTSCVLEFNAFSTSCESTAACLISSSTSNVRVRIVTRCAAFMSVWCSTAAVWDRERQNKCIHTSFNVHLDNWCRFFTGSELSPSSFVCCDVWMISSLKRTITTISASLFTSELKTRRPQPLCEPHVCRQAPGPTCSPCSKIHVCHHWSRTHTTDQPTCCCRAWPKRAHPSAPRHAHCEFDAAAAVAVAVETTAVPREGWYVVEEAVHRNSVYCNHPPNRAWRDHCTWFDALDGSSLHWGTDVDHLWMHCNSRPIHLCCQTLFTSWWKSCCHRCALWSSSTTSVSVILTLWTFTFTNRSSSAPTPNFIIARRQLTERNRMFLRGEASDHCHHFESFDICRCLQSNTTFMERWIRLSVGFHPSLTGTPVLTLPTPSTLWRFASTIAPTRQAAFTAPALLLHGCSELVWHGFTSESLIVLVGDLRYKSGNRVEFLNLCISETYRCVNHCTLDFGDFGILHGVHQCVLGASRVALQLGCCIPLECFVVVADWCHGSCFLNLLHRGRAALVSLSGGELNWLTGSGVVGLGRGPELLLRYHVRVARVSVVHWALGLQRPPTACPIELGTGVLWVSTGASRTLDDVLRLSRWIIDVCSCRSVWKIFLALCSWENPWTMGSLHGKQVAHFLQIPATFAPQCCPRLLVDCSRENTTSFQNLVQ